MKNLFFLFPLFLSTTLSASTIFDLLHAQSEVLEVRLEADFDHLFQQEGEDEKHPALFVWTDADGTEHEELIKVKLRGKYRRQVCDFKPLMLKFSKKSLARQGLSDHNDLKLVTHCTGSKLAGKSAVLREHLAYQLYAHLTPRSFRTQLLRITYVNSRTHERTRRWAMIIEDTDEMAERLGGVEMDEVMNLPANTVDLRQEQLMSVFQLMIGNQDYNLRSCRNVKYVFPHDGSPAIAVPYDFDFTGMVNADYAVPNPNYPVVSIFDRVWLGRPATEQELSSITAYLTHERKNLIALVDDYKLLQEEERQAIIDYLDSFYRIQTFSDLLDGKVAYYISSYVPKTLEGYRAATE